MIVMTELHTLRERVAAAQGPDRERGDDVHAIFFAVKAAETLQLAKALAALSEGGK